MLELRVCLVWSYLLVSTVVRFAHVLREETFLPHVTSGKPMPGYRCHPGAGRDPLAVSVTGFRRRTVAG